MNFKSGSRLQSVEKALQSFRRRRKKVVIRFFKDKRLEKTPRPGPIGAETGGIEPRCGSSACQKSKQGKENGRKSLPCAKGGGTAEAVTEGLKPLQEQPLRRLAAPAPLTQGSLGFSSCCFIYFLDGLFRHAVDFVDSLEPRARFEFQIGLSAW